MSTPVILLDAGQLVSLVGSADGDVLTWDATSSAWVSEAGGGGGGSGTVTSVTLDAGSTGLMISAGYSQTITTSGTFLLGGTLGAGYGGTGVSTTSQGYVFAGPASGGLGTPSFRQLSAADITGISGTYAPLASPTFTGTVTLPLATAGYVKTTSGGVISSSATVAVADLSGAVAVANGGTNNGSLSVVQGTVYYGNGSQLVGLAPGNSGQFLQTQGASANPQWATAGGGGSGAYDLRGMFVGNPATSAVIDRFVADRAVTVSTTTTDHRFYCATLPASGTVVLTVCQTPLAGTGKVAMFVVTYTAGGTAAGNGLYAATIGTVSNNTLVAGDLVTVEVGTTQAAFATPVWTIAGTA